MTKAALARRKRKRLRVTYRKSNAPGVEPVAAAIRAAMDAGGLSQADVARYTGLSPQLVSRLVNRRRPYGNRPPATDTQQKLPLIPGLSEADLQDALMRSMGQTVSDERPAMSSLRLSAHNLVDQVPEEELQRVVRLLTAMI